MYIVAYDITEPKRLKRIAKLLNRYGQRVQKSVYECDIDESRYYELRDKLKRLMQGDDSVIAYRLRRFSAQPTADYLNPQTKSPSSARGGEVLPPPFPAMDDLIAHRPLSDPLHKVAQNSQ